MIDGVREGDPKAVSRVEGGTGRIRFAGSNGSQPLSHTILISREYVRSPGILYENPGGYAAPNCRTVFIAKHSGSDEFRQSTLFAPAWMPLIL